MKKWMKKEVFVGMAVLLIMVIFYQLGSADHNKKDESDQAEIEQEVVSTISDKEILTKSNHAVLLGSITQAKEVWTSNRDRVALFDSDQDSIAEGSTEQKILVMKGYGDVIREIKIAFSQMKETELTLEQVVEITVSYLPWELLEENYEPYTANVVSKIEDPEHNTKYYEIMFAKKEGIKGSLPYEIGAVIQANPDGTFESTIQTNPELLNLLLHGLEMKEWSVDLSVYHS